MVRGNYLCLDKLWGAEELCELCAGAAEAAFDGAFSDA